MEKDFFEEYSPNLLEERNRLIHDLHIHINIKRLDFCEQIEKLKETLTTIDNIVHNHYSAFEAGNESHLIGLLYAYDDIKRFIEDTSEERGDL